MWEELFHVIWALGVIAVVLALAYGCTRMIAGHSGTRWMTSYQGRKIQVLEKVVVGKEQQLLLVRLGEVYCFLGVSQGNITCLRQATEEEIRLWEQEDTKPLEAGETMNFASALRKVIRQRNGKEEG
ncbi:MAG: FliO/MopB family protein [Lawsonibacter sp.]|jgi:flagellar biogenesis protein FliO